MGKQRVRGTIRKYVPLKSIGFIRTNDAPELAGVDIHFRTEHVLNAFTDGLFIEEGAPVEFRPFETPRGWKAADVALIEEQQMQERQKGTIKNYFSGRGFGFIVRPGEPDCFFHVRDSQVGDETELQPGRAVEFDTTSKDGRTRAVDVVLLGENGGAH